MRLRMAINPKFPSFFIAPHPLLGRRGLGSANLSLRKVAFTSKPMLRLGSAVLRRKSLSLSRLWHVPA